MLQVLQELLLLCQQQPNHQVLQVLLPCLFHHQQQLLLLLLCPSFLLCIAQQVQQLLQAWQQGQVVQGLEGEVLFVLAK